MLLLTGALFAPVSMPVSTQAALLPTQRLRTDGGCWGTSPGPRGSFFDRAGHLTEEVVKAEGAVWECVAGCSASKLPSEFWLVCVCVCVWLPGAGFGPYRCLQLEAWSGLLAACALPGACA